MITYQYSAWNVHIGGMGLVVDCVHFNFIVKLNIKHGSIVSISSIHVLRNQQIQYKWLIFYRKLYQFFTNVTLKHMDIWMLFLELSTFSPDENVNDHKTMIWFCHKSTSQFAWENKLHHFMF